MKRMQLSTFQSRKIAFITLLIVLALQVFAESTIATEKRELGGSSKTARSSALKAASIPQELLAVEKRYVAAKTLEANFTQLDEIKLTGSTKNASGVLMIRHPNQFRWETLKPDKNLLVTNGQKFWFYTPPFEAGERGQVIEKRTNEVQSELANHVLSGSFSKIKGVEIQKISSTRFKLLPSEGVAGTVKTAELEINPKSNTIERLVLEHQGGNRTEIKLTEIQLAKKLNDGYFRFVTPPGTDIIRE
jgi:outer membrane lipoprotein carrier protein